MSLSSIFGLIYSYFIDGGMYIGKGAMLEKGYWQGIDWPHIP